MKAKAPSWAPLLLLGLLFYVLAKPKRETIPTWGDSANTG